MSRDSRSQRVAKLKERVEEFTKRLPEASPLGLSGSIERSAIYSSGNSKFQASSVSPQQGNSSGSVDTLAGGKPFNVGGGLEGLSPIAGNSRATVSSRLRINPFEGCEQVLPDISLGTVSAKNSEGTAENGNEAAYQRCLRAYLSAIGKQKMREDVAFKYLASPNEQHLKQREQHRRLSDEIDFEQLLHQSLRKRERAIHELKRLSEDKQALTREIEVLKKGIQPSTMQQLNQSPMLNPNESGNCFQQPILAVELARVRRLEQQLSQTIRNRELLGRDVHRLQTALDSSKEEMRIEAKGGPSRLAIEEVRRLRAQLEQLTIELSDHHRQAPSEKPLRMASELEHSNIQSRILESSQLKAREIPIHYSWKTRLTLIFLACLILIGFVLEWL